MQKKIKSSRQNIWDDCCTYFLTDSTYLHYPYFSKDKQKEIVLDRLRKAKERFGIKISSFSIAINHYHVKFYLDNGSDMLKIKQFLRGGISYEYRKCYSVPYKEMWQSRKIVPIASKEDDWRIACYISGNLLKHREVGTLKELEKNKFSSYGHMLERYGKNEMKDWIYGIIGIDEDKYGNVDIRSLSQVRLKPR